MQNLLARLLLLSLFAFSTGCVTQTIKEGKDLSSSGIAYADAVDSLVDVTIDTVIDFDNQDLILAHPVSSPEQQLLQRNDAAQLVLLQLSDFRAHTKVLKAYFLNLQALADSPVKDDAGAAVKSLSDTISKINTKNGKETLSDDEKTQIGALAGIAASAIQADKIKRALVRDAPVIGTYLALQKSQLKNVTDLLKSRFIDTNRRLYVDQIRDPYMVNRNPLPSGWADSRKQWLKASFSNAQLDAANVAADHLSSVWADIVAGKTDIDAISGLLTDVGEFVNTVAALQAAQKAASEDKGAKK